MTNLCCFKHILLKSTKKLTFWINFFDARFMSHVFVCWSCLNIILFVRYELLVFCVRMGWGKEWALELASWWTCQHQKNTWNTFRYAVILLMEEILHHLECGKPFRLWDKHGQTSYLFWWSRIYSINTMVQCFHFQVFTLLFQCNPSLLCIDEDTYWSAAFRWFPEQSCIGFLSSWTGY